MFCDKCGSENRDSAEFCSQCGMKLQKPKPAAGDTGNGAAEQSTPTSFIERFKHAVSDRYEIIRELGRGGMAIVFLAKDKRLDREVALKLLPEDFQHDESFRERFIREARVSAKLSHPNIIQIHDVNEFDDFTYFSMSFIEGVSLSHILRKGGGLNPKAIATLGIHICFGLQHAHDHDVIHRDIKPENILITKKRMPVVVDFGIAKALTEAKLSQTGMLIGTPHYMSPEQIKTGNVDCRSDIYSLGCVLYEMATGKPPFHGKDPTALMYHHVNEMPPPPNEVKSSIPASLSAVIMKALAKKPEDRYQKVAELGKDLHDTVLKKTAGAAAAGAASAQTEKTVVAGSGKQNSKTAPEKPGTPVPDSKDTGDSSETLVSESIPAQSQTSEKREGAIGDTLVSQQQATENKQSRLPKERQNRTSRPLIIGASIGIASLIALAAIGGSYFLNRPTAPVETVSSVPAPQQAETPESTELPSDSSPKSSEAEQQERTKTVNTSGHDSAGRQVNAARSAETSGAPSDTKTAPKPVSASASNQQSSVPSPPPAQQGASEPEQLEPAETTPPAASSRTPKLPSAAQENQVAVKSRPEPAGQPPPVKIPPKTQPARPETPKSSAAPINWVFISSGTFIMGDSQGDMEEQLRCRPTHSVTVSSFEMSRDEITVEQYALFIKATGHREPDQWNQQLKKKENPVVYVSWSDADAFAKWAGARLPTEAEWEFAARGGFKGQKYPWGNFSPEGRANFNNPWEQGRGWITALKKPGSYPSNLYGLNDMAGNVWEWCADWFGPYSSEHQVNPAGAGSGRFGRVVRGGGWNSGAKQIRNSVRGPIDPNKKAPHVGFRIAKGGAQ